MRPDWTPDWRTSKPAGALGYAGAGADWLARLTAPSPHPTMIAASEFNRGRDVAMCLPRVRPLSVIGRREVHRRHVLHEWIVEGHERQVSRMALIRPQRVNR